MILVLMDADNVLVSGEEFFGKLCPAIEKYNEALPADGKIIIDGGEGSLTGICATKNSRTY